VAAEKIRKLWSRAAVMFVPFRSIVTEASIVNWEYRGGFANDKKFVVPNLNDSALVQFKF
jgi:hypothetical protein